MLAPHHDVHSQKRRTRRAFTATYTFAPRNTITPPTAEPTSDDGTIDWIAVERAAEGTYAPSLLTPDEKRAAALLMLKAGYSELAAADRIGVEKRQISRWKNGAAGRPAPYPCGTNAAYNRHTRRHEKPCQPCRDAHRAYRNGQKAVAA
jgi:hypothetical protein